MSTHSSRNGPGEGPISIKDSTPHSKLWFDDGSLVIQASSSRYRIHRTIICNHSVIFRDMMSLPPADPTLYDKETYDGCPIVWLPDNSDDVDRLLEALYDPEYFSRLWQDIDSDLTVQITLRFLLISTKYEFWSLRNNALKILEYHCPTEIGKFMALSTESSIVPKTQRTSVMIEKQMEHFFSIIRASRTCGLLQFIPSTLYRLFYLLAPDGSDDHLLINAPSDQIDDIDKSWCISGGNRMEKIDIFAEPLTFTRHPKSKCSPPSQWNLAADKSLFSKIFVSTITDGLCHKCTLEAEREYYARQKKAWELLPDYFGFRGKSWKELETAGKS